MARGGVVSDDDLAADIEADYRKKLNKAQTTRDSLRVWINWLYSLLFIGISIVSLCKTLSLPVVGFILSVANAGLWYYIHYCVYEQYIDAIQECEKLKRD